LFLRRRFGHLPHLKDVGGTISLSRHLLSCVAHHCKESMGASRMWSVGRRSSLLFSLSACTADGVQSDRVLYGQEDPAHISFVREVRGRWFPEMAAKYNARYDATSDWRNLNADFLASVSGCGILDTVPRTRATNGISGVHGTWRERGWASISRFCVDRRQISAKDWYHIHFSGPDHTSSNSVETDVGHARQCRRPPSTRNVPSAETFRVLAAMSRYRWEKRSATDPDIDILLSIDSSSFRWAPGPRCTRSGTVGTIRGLDQQELQDDLRHQDGSHDIDYEHKGTVLRTRRCSAYPEQYNHSGSADHRWLLWLGRNGDRDKKKGTGVSLMIRWRFTLILIQRTLQTFNSFCQCVHDP